jgi:tetratricopeptide (TPR) repeat protein
MKTVASFLFMICISLQAMSQGNDELAAKARKAYDASQFPKAIQFYEKIIGNGYESVVLYYNLGNAYFRNNEIPSAILYYEKALKLEPNHADIQHNLAIANSRITDKVEVVPELFYKHWWKTLLNSMSIDSLGIVMIILLSFTLIFLATYLLSRSVAIRKISFWISVSLFAFFFISLFAAQQKENQIINNHEAIVFTPTVTIKSSPDNASADLFVIHEGIKVVLLDQIGEWQEIRIANGSVGWLRATDIRLI